MKQIVFTNMKGGSGKTTLAIATASALAQGGFRVGFRDADSQQSLQGAQADGVFKGTNIVWAPPGQGTYDYVVIDTAPRLSDPKVIYEIDRADLIILVTETSSLSLKPTAAAYTSLRQRRPAAKIVLLVNGFDPNRRLDRYLDENLERVGLGNVPILSVRVKDREIYRYLTMGGWDLAKEAFKSETFLEAQQETADLAASILQFES